MTQLDSLQYEKITIRAEKLLNAVLGRISFLQGLPEASQQAIKTQSPIASFAPGQTIFKQGDASEAFYIIISGSVRISVRNAEGENVALVELGEGEIFGEQGLLSNETRPRNASASAVSATSLIQIDKHIFDEHIRASKYDAMVLKGLADATKRLEVSSSLSTHLKASSLENMVIEQRSFDEGQTVFRQGDESDHVYVIESGQAEVYQEDAGRLITLSRIGAGGFFGERGVLSESPRSATVVANSDLQLLVLDGKKFKEEVGQSDRLASLMDAYEGIYELPRRGFVLLSRQKVNDQEAATALYKLHDNRQVIVSKSVSDKKVTFRECDVERSSVVFCVSELAPNVQLGYIDSRLVLIEAPIEWPGLNQAAVILLEGLDFAEWSRRIFALTGMLNV